MKEIPLTQGKVAVVDDEDYERLAKHKWCYSQGYAKRTIKVEGVGRRQLPMHQAIIGKNLDGGEVDHADRDRLNNQKSNLRFCTNAQNQWNRNPQGGTSKYKGVYWNKSTKKWKAQIRVPGKRIYLGLFKIEEEAARAYDRAAREIHGSFARCNFKEGPA